ncbi:MAG TPA: TIGR03435 family protein [Bryobacteraceae bacterium]|nr:TIGR03435 family protein [Bryobacteraceae bacterium]
MSPRAVLLSACLLLPLYSQQKPHEFDVVSVKPHPVAPNQGMFRNFEGKPAPHAQGNRFREQSTTLEWLVMEAYGVEAYEIAGLPDWGAPAIGGTYFHVEAIAPGTDAPAPADLQQMIQSLLAKRFALKAHRETKQLPVYGLGPGKNGVKFRPLRDDEQLSTGRSTPEERPLIKGRFPSTLALIRLYADRPVVDETGLKGNYEMAHIDFSAFAQERRQDPQEAWAQLAAAMKDKWGLEVRPRVDSVSVLVIDHVELPSPND